MITPAISFDDILLLPQYSEINSRSDIDLCTHITPKVKLDLPLISINMDCVTSIDMALAMSNLGAISFYPRFDTIANQVKAVKQILAQKARVIPAVGIKPAEKDRVKALYDIGIRTITIDVAHAHLKLCLDFVKSCKKEYRDLEIIAGVVGTYQGARDLYRAGADSVRVGLGPGSICTTRVTTGHGVPQISALIDVYRAAREFDRPFLADGGTKNSGDIVKALACGASAVVIGSQLAGTSESAGKLVTRNGQKFKTYNASTSQTEKLNQFKKNSTDKTKDYTGYVEGIESLVPYQGSLTDVLKRLEMGLRSGFSYSGAKNIKEFHKKAKIIRVSPTIAHENNNRGVILT